MAFLLVVDDDPAILFAVQRILETHGHHASTAAAAAPALALPDSPDLAVIDVMLPGMNGIELAHRLRARNPNLPILFLTGAPNLVDLRQFPNALILSKPWRAAAFLGAVSNLLAKKRGTRS